EPRSDRPAAARDQLLLLQQEEQKLLESRGAKHPEVVSVRRRITAARDQLTRPAAALDDSVSRDASRSSDPVDRYVELLRQRIQHLSQSEQLLADVYRDEQGAAKKLASYEVQDESFRTSIGLTRQSYEAINRRLQDLSLVKGMGGYEVETINPP